MYPKYILVCVNPEKLIHSSYFGPYPENSGLTRFDCTLIVNIISKYIISKNAFNSKSPQLKQSNFYHFSKIEAKFFLGSVQILFLSKNFCLCVNPSEKKIYCLTRKHILSFVLRLFFWKEKAIHCKKKCAEIFYTNIFYLKLYI